ncbi:MAG: CPBP family intramembrane metalloprotease [Verrucomicrobia bacterium]|nr:CPBP family intramembrane metalloprotease [Verrucomicrobiota bacterium]
MFITRHLPTIELPSLPSAEELPQKIETALSNRWVQTAIVVGGIVFSCLIVPSIALFINTVVLAPFFLLEGPFMRVFESINAFLPSFTPLVQTVLGIGVIIIGSIAYSIWKRNAKEDSSKEEGVPLALSLATTALTIPFTESHLPDFTSSHITAGKNSLLKLYILIPIVEEIFFRGLIPLLFRSALRLPFFIASKIAKKDYMPTVEKIIAVTQNIFSSTLFGIAHSRHRHSARIPNAIVNGITACLAYFPAFERGGLPASVLSHMSNNVFTVIGGYIFDKIDGAISGLFPKRA